MCFPWPQFETAKHILYLCLKDRFVWNSISCLMGKSVSFPDGFSAGNWITEEHNLLSNFAKSVVATTAWFL